MKLKSNPRLRYLLLAVLGSLVLVACGGSGSAYLQEGDQAPEFALPTAQGEAVSLAQYQGEKPVLLYFHMALG